MPVGNSDRGVGLGAGEIMLFADVNYQNFKWWHDIVPGAIIPGTTSEELFEHKGQFNNKNLNLGFTIGINDYWNMTISQLISERCMDWEGPVFTGQETLAVDGFDFNSDIHTIGGSKSVHHRSECSSSDFYDGDNQIAFGGYLGDTKINFKYLLYNQGKGPGNRVFIGGGLLIPSSSTITESPWVKSDHDNNPITDDTYTPHRHFYLSDGAYKMFTEIQFFKKRVKKPVFVGGTLSVNFPLNKSDYGFKPSTNYELSLMALSGPLNHVKSSLFMLSSIGFNFTIAYSGRSEWNGVVTPNSEAILYIPGISLLFNSKSGKVGTFGLNIQKGYEDYLSNNPSDIEETNEIYAISLSYRKMLDKYIEKFYWK